MARIPGNSSCCSSNTRTHTHSRRQISFSLTQRERERATLGSAVNGKMKANLCTRTWPLPAEEREREREPKPVFFRTAWPGCVCICWMRCCCCCRCFCFCFCFCYSWAYSTDWGLSERISACCAFYAHSPAAKLDLVNCSLSLSLSLVCVLSRDQLRAEHVTHVAIALILMGTSRRFTTCWWARDAAGCRCRCRLSLPPPLLLGFALSLLCRLQFCIGLAACPHAQLLFLLLFFFFFFFFFCSARLGGCCSWLITSWNAACTVSRTQRIANSAHSGKMLINTRRLFITFSITTTRGDTQLEGTMGVHCARF